MLSYLSNFPYEFRSYLIWEGINESKLKGRNLKIKKSKLQYKKNTFPHVKKGDQGNEVYRQCKCVPPSARHAVSPLCVSVSVSLLAATDQKDDHRTMHFYTLLY